MLSGDFERLRIFFIICGAGVAANIATTPKQAPRAFTERFVTRTTLTAVKCANVKKGSGCYFFEAILGFSSGAMKELSPLTVECIGKGAYAHHCEAFLRSLLGPSLSDLKVLDVGCGRGDLVGNLRLHGTRAFGIDINENYIECGSILSNLYPDEFKLLSCPDERGRTVFPDAYFDVVVSFQVLEHVEKLDVLVNEIARLTRPGGMTVHLFPAKFRVMEPHFKLPFVHWLPKNSLRKAAIRMMLSLRPNVVQPAARANGLFNYSVQHTFYRSAGKIRDAFARHKFELMRNDGWEALLASRAPKFRLMAGLIAPISNLFWTSIVVGRRKL